jgi:hypothetical protein
VAIILDLQERMEEMHSDFARALEVLRDHLADQLAGRDEAFRHALVPRRKDEG